MRILIGTMLLAVTLFPPVEVAAQRAAQGAAQGAPERAAHAATPAAGGAQRRRAQPAPAMREVVYKMLREAQECAEAEDYTCARDIVESVRGRDDLNSYERAQAWNFQAFIDFKEDDTPAAINAYEHMLAEPALPLALEQNTRYTLAQLYASQERYDSSLTALDEWWQVGDAPTAPEPYVLRSQLQYERGAYEEGLEAITGALDLAAAQGREPEEGWYQLMVAQLWELGEQSRAADALETMIRLWPKRDYYLQLSRVYGDLGNDVRELDLYEGAYAAGWLETEAEILTLTNLLLDAERPADARDVIEQGMARGVVEASAENLELLGRATDASDAATGAASDTSSDAASNAGSNAGSDAGSDAASGAATGAATVAGSDVASDAAPESDQATGVE